MSSIYLIRIDTPVIRNLWRKSLPGDILQGLEGNWEPRELSSLVGDLVEVLSTQEVEEVEELSIQEVEEEEVVRSN